MIAPNLNVQLYKGVCFMPFSVGYFCCLQAEYLAQGKHQARIVVTPRQRYPIGEPIRRLSGLVRREAAEEMKKRLKFL